MNRAVWSIALFVAATFGLGFVGVAYTSHVQHQTEQKFERAQQVSDQRWCGLFLILNAPDAPPTTERGRQVQQRINALSDAFHCERSR